MTFCVFLHEAEHWYRRFFKNPYIRILAASLILIGLTLVTGTRAYNGSSMGLIEQAIDKCGGIVPLLVAGRLDEAMNRYNGA